MARALGFELEEHLLPQRGPGAAHTPSAWPQEYKGSFLPGYLGPMGSHTHGTLTLAENLLRIVEAHYSIGTLKFLKCPALTASECESCLECTGENCLLRAFL